MDFFKKERRFIVVLQKAIPIRRLSTNTAGTDMADKCDFSNLNGGHYSVPSSL